MLRREKSDSNQRWITHITPHGREHRSRTSKIPQASSTALKHSSPTMTYWSGLCRAPMSTASTLYRRQTDWDSTLSLITKSNCTRVHKREATFLFSPGLPWRILYGGYYTLIRLLRSASCSSFFRGFQALFCLQLLPTFPQFPPRWLMEYFLSRSTSTEFHSNISVAPAICANKNRP